MDGAPSIDVARAHRLEQRGYRVWTQTIAKEITAKARLLLGDYRGTRTTSGSAVIATNAAPDGNVA